MRQTSNSSLFISEPVFEEKIPIPKSVDVLPPIHSCSRPPRKAWDPVMRTDVISEQQIGRKPVSHEIKQT